MKRFRLKKVRQTLIVFAGLVLLSSSLCQAEDIDLERIVVTPNRNEEEMGKTPNNISVITKGQIERSKAKTIPELLSGQGSVIMRDYIGNGKTTNADIRGFGETGLSNVLVLVDGRRVNNIDLSGTDWTQIPVSMVEKIEILRGAGSVLYGDNASGGVINIITKEPAYRKNELKLGLLGGSYGTYGENIELSLDKENFSGLGLFEQYRTDGYRINSDLIRNDFNGKLKYSLNESLKTRFTFGNHTDKYGLPGGLLDGELNTRDRRASVTPDDFARSRDYFIDFGIEGDLDEFGKVEVDLAKRKRDTFFNNVKYSWMSERNTVTYTMNSKYLLENKIFRNRNKFIAGIDYFDAEQDINDGSYAGNPDKLTLSKKDYGFYLMDQFYFTDKFSFTGGTRYETARYNFEQEAVLIGSEKSRFKESVFNAALNYNYRADSNVYLSFANSFRLPLVDEVYVNKFDYGLGPGGGLNSALGPQTAKNYEAGIRHSLNKNFLIGLTGYMMKVRNEIYYEPTTGNNTNYDKTIHRGLEFSTDMKWDERIKLFANYTFTDAYFKGGTYDKKMIPAVPVHKWSLGGDIKFHKYFIFSLVGNYIGERYFISDQANVLPRMASYLTVDTKLIFDKGIVSAFLGINNLFNEEYYEYGAASFDRTYKNYYPAAERNFTVGGSIKF
ncbi:MAG: TonB-dependent receptor [Candidatus Omnitrophica bacterium]|nr:TonB-dependent receptor [Candidatus Omnitrophota bacterium]MDD5591742.1 TonB-dependent receptor [Candidatus Omnitrophota bacterium]